MVVKAEIVKTVHAKAVLVHLVIVSINNNSLKTFLKS